jgi:serine/threonine protein kinase
MPVQKEKKSLRLLTPDQVAQAYTKIKFVGEGSFGKVFKARERSAAGAERWVALKYIKLKSARLTADALRELKTLRALAPKCGPCHLVCYHTHFLTSMAAKGGRTHIFLVIVMQFVAGGDLAAQAASLTASEIHRVAQQLFEAVKCLHGAGYMHRDIKPANVLFQKGRDLNQNNHLVLADYGLACLKDWCTGTPGTPAYMWGPIRKGKGKQLSTATYKAGDLYGAAKTILRLLQGPEVDATLRGKLDGPSKSPKLSALMRRVMEDPTDWDAGSVLQKLKTMKK